MYFQTTITNQLSSGVECNRVKGDGCFIFTIPIKGLLNDGTFEK